MYIAHDPFSLYVMATLIYVLCSLLNILKLDTTMSCLELIKFETEVKEQKALFIFGDSLFDVGNNVYLNKESTEGSTYWPYGETFFKHPTGRYSDGRLVPDFIATFAGLPLLPAYLQPGPHQFTYGANFASVAACVVFPGKDYIDLGGQLGYFKDAVKTLKQEEGDTEATKVLNNAVYLFTIGSVDYLTFRGFNPRGTTESYKKVFVQRVMGNLVNVIKEVYSLGGRKIAFQNVGALGCTPDGRIDFYHCDEELMSLTRQHNAALSAALAELQRNLPGFKYSIFDYYHAILDRTDNPSKYGFKVGKVACCGLGRFRRDACGLKYGSSFQLCSDPLQYTWFDGFHPGDEANRQLAELFWSGSPNITGPHNLKQLFEY